VQQEDEKSQLKGRYEQFQLDFFETDAYPSGAGTTSAGGENKERELERRESAIAERERHLEQQLDSLCIGDWPSRCCRVARHNISEDVPQGKRFVVWVSYWHYLSFCLTLLANLACVSAALVSPKILAVDKDGNEAMGALVSAWFFSLLITLVSIPLVFGDVTTHGSPSELANHSIMDCLNALMTEDSMLMTQYIRNTESNR